MPDAEQVMRNQTGTGNHHERGAQPETVGEAPENLAKGLGMAGNTSNPSFIEAHLRLGDRSNFQQVKGRWIEQ
ncbi:hypothetical protein AL714_19295, partial [Clostridium botulinum]